METKKHPNKWLCVYPGDYFNEMAGDRAEFGAIMFDLFYASMTNTEPKHAVNLLAINRSHKMWEDWLAKKMTWKKKGEDKVKELKTKVKEYEGGKPPKPDIYSVVKGEYPKEEILAWAESMNIKLGKKYQEWCESNGWKDSTGKPIMNWKRAMIAYEERHNPEHAIKNEPATAQPGEEPQ